MNSARAATLVAVGAAVWLVALTIVDVLSPSAVFATLFALAPLAICALAPVRVTVAFSVVAVALTVLSGLWNHDLGSAQQVIRIADVAVVSSAAVVIATVRVRREHQFARVAKIAEVAQRVILPILPRTAAGVSVAARYQSAAEDAMVGGDLFDCYLAPTHTRLIVGDVRGKGLAAVEQAARVIRAFRQAAATEPSLDRVAADMSAYLDAFFDDEEFATALLVDVTDPDRLTITSCGHPQALLVRQGGGTEFVDAPAGTPLGLGQDFSAVSVPWSTGDRLLMYTDGVTEARDAGGQFLRLRDVAPRLRAASIDEALDALLDEVRTHVPRGRLGDDVAVVLLENSGAERYEKPAPELYMHPRAVAL